MLNSRFGVYTGVKLMDEGPRRMKQLCAGVCIQEKCVCVSVCVCVYPDEKELTFYICSLVLWLFKNISSFVPSSCSFLPSSKAAAISFFKLIMEQDRPQEVIASIKILHIFILPKFFFFPKYFPSVSLFSHPVLSYEQEMQSNKALVTHPRCMSSCRRQNQNSPPEAQCLGPSSGLVLLFFKAMELFSNEMLN